MSRPTSVSVMGSRITIEYTGERLDDDSSGIFDPENLSIKIHDTVYYDRTLLHEVCHAVFYLTGLTSLLTEEMEEALCTALENGLFGIYKRDF